MSGKGVAITVSVLIAFAAVFGSVFYFVFAPGGKTSVSQVSQSSGPDVISGKTPSSSVPQKSVSDSQAPAGAAAASTNRAVAPQPSRSTRTS